MAGRTRSSLPTDQRRRNTTIPGMAGGSAEAQRAWSSPPERQRRTLWRPTHPAAALGPGALGCAGVSPSPHGPQASRPLAVRTHRWAGPSAVLTTPGANTQDLSSQTPVSPCS